MTIREPRTPGPVGNEESWNESLYAWWYDTSAGVAGFVRIAHNPRERRAQVWTGVITRDGRRFRRWDDELLFTDALRGSGRWQADGLCLAFTDDDTFHVTYSCAECEIDLVATDLHTPMSLQAASGDVSAEKVESMIGKGHVEASIRALGRVRLGGDEFAIDGMGHRDHSWGPRHLMDIRSTRWFHGTTGSDFAFSAATGVMSTGGVHRAGYIVRDSTISPLSDVNIILHTEIDGLSWRRADFILTPVGGESLHGTLDGVFDGMVFGSKEFIAFETAARLVIDGHTGVGNCQTSNNPFGGVSMPAMASLASVTDGLCLRPP